MIGSALEHRTPGFTRPDVDQYYLTARQTPVLAEYAYDEHRGHVYIDDPAWGRETIGDAEGDELFVALFNHPVFRRLSGVEQLTLPKQYATIPNSSEFTRWEHAWGSVAFVRKMIREAEEGGRTFTAREKQVLQLRTLVSDAGQKTFSHLIDWLVQGYGGPEDQHDRDLLGYLELSGVNDLLRQFGVAPQEVVFPDIEDWIECPAPDLCVDRADYIVRETIRWVDPHSTERWRNAFKLDDQNRLVMKRQDDAKYLGACAGLLSTEHHAQPVHRLQLQLFGELIKGAALAGPSFARDPNLHILDTLYTTDQDVLFNVRTVGPLNNDLDILLLDIARRQRQIFSHGRDAEIDEFLARLRVRPDLGIAPPSFPHPLHAQGWKTEYTGFTPLNVEIKDNPRYGKAARITPRKHTIDVSLPALKPRSIDPLYLDTDGQPRRLSQEDPHYAKMLEDCRALQRLPYMAKVHLAPHAISRLDKDLRTTNDHWREAVRRPHRSASAEALRDSLGIIGILAVTHSPNRIVSTDYDGYS